MFKKFGEMFKDENGYGVIELMVIMAALGTITGAVFTTLQGGSDSGLEGAANDVNTKLNDEIQSW